MKLIYVPIEPLAERYTESWYNNFPKEFKTLGWDVTVIDGIALSDTVGVGTFLDINSTIHYKNSQMMRISEMFHKGEVEDGTHFFFGDLEFWGIESLRLMAQMNGLGIKIHGYLHAASFTNGDAFSVASDYQQYTELGWIASVNTVFVGTQYQKTCVMERRLSLIKSEFIASNLASRIVVVGNPMFIEDYLDYNQPKLDQIVLPNRFDEEKQPLKSLHAAVALAEHFDMDVVVTTGRSTFKGNNIDLINAAEEIAASDPRVTIKAGLTKDEYHRELSASKYMLTHSPEESFGYCIAESMIYGCIPICLNNASHPELLSDIPEMLFSSDLSLQGIISTVDFDATSMAAKASVRCNYDSKVVLSNISLTMLNA